MTLVATNIPPQTFDTVDMRTPHEIKYSGVYSLLRKSDAANAVKGGDFARALEKEKLQVGYFYTTDSMDHNMCAVVEDDNKDIFIYCADFDMDNMCVAVSAYKVKDTHFVMCDAKAEPVKLGDETYLRTILAQFQDQMLITVPGAAHKQKSTLPQLGFYIDERMAGNSITAALFAKEMGAIFACHFDEILASTNGDYDSHTAGSDHQRGRWNNGNRHAPSGRRG